MVSQRGQICAGDLRKPRSETGDASGTRLLHANREILGLTWDCVDLSEEALASGNASLFINKELKRCEKAVWRHWKSAVGAKSFYVSGVEAGKLQDNAHIKNAENSQQRPHGLSSENRCTCTDRDEEAAGRREDAAWL